MKIRFTLCFSAATLSCRDPNLSYTKSSTLYYYCPLSSYEMFLIGSGLTYLLNNQPRPNVRADLFQ